MKKRFIFLVLALVATMVYAAEYSSVRPAGTSTLASGIFYMPLDSADTFVVDTFTSDVVTIDTGANYVNIALALDGFTICDSCNDSVVIIVKTMTHYASITPLAVYTDTFATTLDSTEVIRHHLYRDTLIENKLYFQTIVKDSFINSASWDSLLLQMNYHVLTQ